MPLSWSPVLAAGTRSCPLRGALAVDDILGEVGSRLTLLLAADDRKLAGIRELALGLRAGDVEWGDRWRSLCEVILPAVPVLVLLDNFEDNLQRDDAVWTRSTRTCLQNRAF